MKRILQKLTPMEPGEDLTAERMNAIQEAIIAMSRGDHIKSDRTIRIGRAEGEVTFRAQPGSRGGGGIRLGFTGSLGGERGDEILVSPSVVSGLDKVHMPEINNQPMDTLPQPSLRYGGGDVGVYLKIGVTPKSEEIPDSDPTKYRIAQLWDSIDDVDIVSGSNYETTMVTVDQDGGAVSKGTYYFPLFKIYEVGSGADSGAKIIQYLYGPMTIRYERGIMYAAPPIIVTTGEFTVFDATDDE